jgi:hypothetical protein
LAVPEAAEIMIPVRPWEARKQAREAPAGPAPIIKYGISMRGFWEGSVGGEVPLGRVVEAMVEGDWVLEVSSRLRVPVVSLRW